MKNLLLALFIVGLIGGCGSTDSDTEEEFEPYKIGTWLVTSPKTADWEGNKQKSMTSIASGDTVNLSSPDNHLLQIHADTLFAKEDDDLALLFVDSTVTKSDSINISLTKFPVFDSFGAFSSGANGKGIGPDWFELELRLVYDCDYDTKLNDLNISIFKKDSTLFRTYLINVEGIEDAAQEIVGC